MVRRWSVLVAALLAPVLLTGLVACSSDDPRTAPSARATPLAKLKISSLRLARAEFCDRIPKTAVRRALGADPSTDASWGNGDPVDGSGGTGDVGHEIGCSWSVANGPTVRAWVFARPVNPAFAAQLVRQAGRVVGCTVEPTTVFGTPSLLQSCTTPRGIHEVRRAGLFGDTWVTCEVTGGAETRTRLDPWCAQVVAAMSA
jgi:hypothetical protein